MIDMLAFILIGTGAVSLWIGLCFMSAHETVQKHR